MLVIPLINPWKQEAEFRLVEFNAGVFGESSG